MSVRFESRDAIRAQVAAVVSSPWTIRWAGDTTAEKPDAGAQYIEEMPIADFARDAARDGTPTGRWRTHVGQLQLMLYAPRTAGPKTFEDLAGTIETRLLSSAMTLADGTPVIVTDTTLDGPRPSPTGDRLRAAFVALYTYTAHNA